jgi:hypothetical protein
MLLRGTMPPNRRCKLWQKRYSSIQQQDRVPLGALLLLLLLQQRWQSRSVRSARRQPRLLLLPLLQLLQQLACLKKTGTSLLLLL